MNPKMPYDPFYYVIVPFVVVYLLNVYNDAVDRIRRKLFYFLVSLLCMYESSVLFYIQLFKILMETKCCWLFSILPKCAVPRGNSIKIDIHLVSFELMNCEFRKRLWKWMKICYAEELAGWMAAVAVLGLVFEIVGPVKRLYHFIPSRNSIWIYMIIVKMAEIHRSFLYKISKESGLD